MNMYITVFPDDNRSRQFMHPEVVLLCKSESVHACKQEIPAADVGIEFEQPGLLDTLH